MIKKLGTERIMDDTTKEEEKVEPLKWEKRDFKMNKNMEHVIRLTIDATKAEIDGLKKKLKKLQYGS